jgi:putative transposase
LSISRQCELIGLSRSTYHLAPAVESAENLRLMRLIDEKCLKTPFYGSRRTTASLERRGEVIHRKRVRRLMALMGLEGLHPRPRTSAAGPAARAYPYLLRDRVLSRVDEVWSSDITYVPMRRGFMYLTAVIDWYSRYVLSWRLSNSLDGPSAWRRWTRRCRGAGRRSSTPTRGRGSRRGSTPAGWRRPGSR